MKRILVLLLILPTVLLHASDPDEIVRRLEQNQIHESAYSEGRMITTDKYGSITRSFRSWAQGEEDALIEFTSKGEDGQKILRTKDEIYLYFPDAEDVLRIQGSALRDSVMDSDFSYEDMTGGKSLLDDYSTSLEGVETVDGVECYKIRLSAKRRSVPYSSQILWIDSSRYTWLKGEKFSRSGTLLKEMKAEEIRTINGKYIPTRIFMQDKMKKNSSTELILDTLDLDLSIDPRTFSLEELTW